MALSPAAVNLDVLTFTQLIDQGTPDIEQAAALYQGNLLAGLNLNEESLETSSCMSNISTRWQGKRWRNCFRITAHRALRRPL